MRQPSRNSPLIHGTFHFHSTYSHDGRRTLAETAARLRQQGFSFCIMTEHFEDFDAGKLADYVNEAAALSDQTFVFVPGVEVNLSGLDTILFPVKDYSQCERFGHHRGAQDPDLFSVLAHVSKYSLESVAGHLESYRIDGVEIWNQQADSSYVPPIQVVDFFRTYPRRLAYRYFFGCDLHDAQLTVTNVLSIPRPPSLTVDSVMAAFRSGSFLASNRVTGIEYANSKGNIALDEWLASVPRTPSYKARALRTARRGLRGAYRSLPRPIQRSLNNLKNFVRNKV